MQNKASSISTGSQETPKYPEAERTSYIADSFINKCMCLREVGYVSTYWDLSELERKDGETAFIARAEDAVDSFIKDFPLHDLLAIPDLPEEYIREYIEARLAREEISKAANHLLITNYMFKRAKRKIAYKAMAAYVEKYEGEHNFEEHELSVGGVKLRGAALVARKARILRGRAFREDKVQTESIQKTLMSYTEKKDYVNSHPNILNQYSEELDGLFGAAYVAKALKLIQVELGIYPTKRQTYTEVMKDVYEEVRILKAQNDVQCDKLKRKGGSNLKAVRRILRRMFRREMVVRFASLLTTAAAPTSSVALEKGFSIQDERRVAIVDELSLQEVEEFFGDGRYSLGEEPSQGQSSPSNIKVARREPVTKGTVGQHRSYSQDDSNKQNGSRTNGSTKSVADKLKPGNYRDRDDEKSLDLKDPDFKQAQQDSKSKKEEKEQKNSILSRLYKLILSKRAERRQNDPDYLTRVDEALNKDRINIAIFGMDKRENREMRIYRADVPMIISIDIESGRVSIIRIPRDTHAPEVDDYSETFKDYPFRINAVMAMTGYDPGEGRKVLEDATGLSADIPVTVDMDTVVKFIDALGGVRVNLSPSFTRLYGKQMYERFGKEIQTGEKLLTGKELLFYVRARHRDSDYERGGRQSGVVGAILKEIARKPQKIPGLIKLAIELTSGEKVGAITMGGEISIGDLLGVFSKAMIRPNRLRDLISSLKFKTFSGWRSLLHGNVIEGDRYQLVVRGRQPNDPVFTRYWEPVRDAVKAFLNQ